MEKINVLDNFHIEKGVADYLMRKAIEDTNFESDGPEREPKTPLQWYFYWQGVRDTYVKAFSKVEDIS